MKIIIFFALASVSVCLDYDSKSSPPVGCPPVSGGGGGGGPPSGSPGVPPPTRPTNNQPTQPSTRCDKPYPNQYANDKTCLEHALENLPELLQSAEKLFCKYRRNEVYRREEYYQGIKKEFNDIVECAGCAVGALVGLEEPLGETGAALGNFTGDISIFIGKTLEAVGLGQPLASFLCLLLSDVLTSECLDKIAKSDISALSEDLKTLSCEAEKQSMKKVTLTANLLRNAGCVVDEFLGLDDAVAGVTGVVGDTLDPLVIGFVRGLKEIPVVGELLTGVACALTNVLNGLVNGGSSGGLLGNLGR